MIGNKVKVILIFFIAGLLISCSTPIEIGSNSQSSSVKNLAESESESPGHVSEQAISDNHSQSEEGNLMTKAVENIMPQEVIQEERSWIMNEEIADIIETLQSMEGLVWPYVNHDSEKLNHATLAFIRNEDYGYNTGGIKAIFWSSYAGNIGQETGIDEEENELYDACEEIAKTLIKMTDPVTGEPVDLKHLFVAIDVFYTVKSELAIEEELYDALFTWGGDLEQFMTEASSYALEKGLSDEDSIIEYTKEKLISDEFLSFTIGDLLADIDGMNIANMMIENEVYLSEAFESYYSGDACWHRYHSFIEAYGGYKSFVTSVDAVTLRKAPYEYTSKESFMDFYESFLEMSGLIASFGSYYERNVEIPEWVRKSVASGFKELIEENLDTEK